MRYCRLLLLLALLWPAPARARPGAPEGAPLEEAPAPTDPTDVAFQRGLSAYQDGRYPAAIAIWEALAGELGADKGWKLHYNLGLAYAAMHNATRAVENFQAFVDQVARQTGALKPSLEQRREDSARRIDAIKSSHGAVVLAVPRTGPVTLVEVDGAAARPAGFTAYLQPGVHTIEVIAPQGQRARRSERIEVVAGASIAIETQDPTPPPPPPPPLLPPPPVIIEKHEPVPDFPLPWVLAGTGATALAFILPAVLWHAAAQARADADAFGRGHTAYAAAVEAYDSARGDYQLSYLLPAGLGAVTATVAVVGYIVSRPDDPEKTGWRVRLGASSIAVEASF